MYFRSGVDSHLAPEFTRKSFAARERSQISAKVMWNFSFRPQYTDDADIRDVEIASSRATSVLSDEVEHFVIGHFAFYNSMGRTEVNPIPTDLEAIGAAGRAEVARWRLGG